MAHHMIVKCKHHDEVVGPEKCTECGVVHGYITAPVCPAECPKHIDGPTPPDQLCAEALIFIEAARKVSRNEEAEADMSLKDWVDAIAARTPPPSRTRTPRCAAGRGRA